MLTTPQSYVLYYGNGLTTVFAYNFYVPTAADMVVSITNQNVTPNVTTVLANTQYAVTGIGNGNEFAGGAGPGGTVTYGVGNPLPTGWTITIQRVVPYVQNTSFPNQGGFYPQVVEAALDYLTMQVQQIAAAATTLGALQGPAGQNGTIIWSGTVPPPAGTGSTGDFYINTSNQYFYGPKGSGGWPSGVPLAGATGANGSTIWPVVAAPGAGLGNNGDWAINTVTSYLYGPKAAGAWPAGVSLIGATGPQGNVSINWQGTWSSTTAYVASQGVTYGGYGYVALQASTGVVPAGNPAYWSCLVVGMYRNRFINGAMRIDQRNAGASQSITTGGGNQYTVDRWFVTCTGTNITGQQMAGSTPWKNIYVLTGAASNTGFTFNQRVESINILDLATVQVTLSVYAASSSLTTLNWTAYYPVSLDTWTTPTSFASGSWTINGALAQYQTTFTLPSSCVNGLQITFSGGALLASQTVTLTGIQLEAGAMATPFEWRPDDVELQRCQRYLPGVRPPQGNIVGYGAATAATTASVFLPFSYPARNTPSVSTSAINSTIGDWTILQLNGNVQKVCSGTITIVQWGSFGVLMGLTCSTGLTAGSPVQLLNSGTADFIFFSGFEL